MIHSSMSSRWQEAVTVSHLSHFHNTQVIEFECLRTLMIVSDFILNLFHCSAARFTVVILALLAFDVKVLAKDSDSMTPARSGQAVIIVRI